MLIDPAQAQTAEATKIAQDGANLLLQYQVLGVLCLLLIGLLIVAGLVIRHLYKEQRADHVRALDDRERLIKALEGARDADEGVAEVLRAIKATYDTRAQAIADLSHQFDKTATETRHGLSNLSQATAGIVDLLREIRSSLQGIFHRPGGG